jgi:hypothetical protein
VTVADRVHPILVYDVIEGDEDLAADHHRGIDQARVLGCVVSPRNIAAKRG